MRSLRKLQRFILATLALTAVAQIIDPDFPGIGLVKLVLLLTIIGGAWYFRTQYKPPDGPPTP